MTTLRLAAVAALLLSATPLAAFADDGLLAGCPAGQTFTAGDISVTGAFTRAMLKGARSAAGYMTISNAGSAADTLTGASSAAAPDVQLHQMKMNGQMMEMSAVKGGLAIPPGGAVSLDPMGYHLMMTGMPVPFAEGQCVELTLHFATAGDLPVVLAVGGPAQMTAPTGTGMSSSTPAGDMDNVDMNGMGSMDMGPGDASAMQGM